MPAKSVLPPQDGRMRADSSEYFAGTGRNELSECHSRSANLKNHTRSSAAMMLPSLSRFEKSAMPGPSRWAARRRIWPGVWYAQLAEMAGGGGVRFVGGKVVAEQQHRGAGPAPLHRGAPLPAARLVG